MNQVWRLGRQPTKGWPSDGDFVYSDEPTAQPARGQALTRTVYLSMDPYQWGRRRSGVEAVGDVCHGRTVSQVVESRAEGYAPGDYVFNTNGWQRYGLTGERVDTFGYMFPRKLDPDIAPISTAVGILGMLGLTAYSGIVVQCRPRPGETVVVSAASGGVGQAAGQIAKLLGCRVVGIAGATEKCDFVATELGLDACVSHRSPSYPEDLAAACPDGVDIYFESVGGHVFEGVLPLLNRDSRISLCGMISQYGNTDGGDAHAVWSETGRAVFSRNRVEVHRLLVRNYVAEHQERFLGEMADWIRDGRVRYREDIWAGLDRAPEAFGAMLAGGNFGKTLVQVSADPTLPDVHGSSRRQRRDVVA